MIDINKQTNELSEQIAFSISARVIYQLGEQLIENEYVALAELIKNAYDADCTTVKINVDTKIDTPYGKGKIEIIDNGNGMTKTILEKAFLKISTSFKIKEKFSPYFERRSLGEKGLGRLSIQRLGNYIEVITTPRLERLTKVKSIPNSDFDFHEKYNTCKLRINWNNYMTDDDFKDIKNECKYSYTNNPIYGTRLEINGLRNMNFWANINTATKTAIRTEIFSMINPFMKKTQEKFEIQLKIDDINFTNNKIDEKVLETISDIIVKFNFYNWKLEMSILHKYKYFLRLQQGLIKRMKDNGYDIFEVIEKPQDYLYKCSIDLTNKDYLLEYPYLNDIFMQYITKENKSILAYPGNFEGTFYVTDLSSDNLNIVLPALKNAGTNIKTQKEIRSIWASAVGVYLFRNDFRILPYGPSFDWLNFTGRSQRVKYNSYKVHNVSGYVHLESKSSQNIKEQTNRQGLIMDEHATNFMIIVKDIISFIAFKTDKKLREGYTTDKINSEDKLMFSKNKKVKFTRNFTEEENVKKHSKEIINTVSKIVKNVDSNNKNFIKEYSVIDKSVKELTNMIHNQQKEQKQREYEYSRNINYYKTLVALAGQSIIVESLTHELYRIEKNISYNSKESILKLEEVEDKISDHFDILVERQENILDSVEYLNEQLSHIEPTYKKNRMIIKNINIYDFLQKIYNSKSTMGKMAEKSNINVIVKGDENLVVSANQGMLITIFDNLFINSIYWLDFLDNQNKASEKNIIFDVNENNRKVTIWDNGPGVHRDIQYKLFEPGEFMKKNGRGLGLYIVKELLEYSNGYIELNMIEKNKHGNCYKFEIRFNK